MAVVLEMQAFGDTILAREFGRMVDDVGDNRPAWPAIIGILEQAEQRQFASAGAYGSGGWAPLAASTRKRKAAMGVDNGVLIATGALQDSLTDSTASGAVRVMQPHQLVFGSTIDYGEYHQQGKGVPKRPPIQLPEADRREVVKVLQRFIMTGSPA